MRRRKSEPDTILHDLRVCAIVVVAVCIVAPVATVYYVARQIWRGPYGLHVFAMLLGAVLAAAWWA